MSNRLSASFSPFAHEDSDVWDTQALVATGCWNSKLLAKDRSHRVEETHPWRASGSAGAVHRTSGGSNGRNQHIWPKGHIDPAGHQKFICVFHVGIQDDKEFCLIKRILGKGGQNMKAIASECMAKVRLRGHGSNFKESDGIEADVPLQLHVSCENYEMYAIAVRRVSTLLEELYGHYRRYMRAKNSRIPNIGIHLEEERRDDWRDWS
eukprot:871768-Amphidinium_carterae.1